MSDLRERVLRELQGLDNLATDVAKEQPAYANATWDAIHRIQRAAGIDDLWSEAIGRASADLSRVPTVDIAREYLRRFDSVNHRLRELDEMDLCVWCHHNNSDHDKGDGHCWACGARCGEDDDE